MQIDEWAAPANGFLCKYDRDRYLFLFEEQKLSSFTEGKFSLLDAVHNIVSPNGIPATISIGIGKDADSYHDLFQFASLSIEMALSRGGDQVVIKNRFTFEFFGGRTKETEKRTKVKSRVMANALGELVNDSSMIFAMGHRMPDFDSVAPRRACAPLPESGPPGLYCRGSEHTLAGDLIERLRELPEYENLFISPQDAIVMADTRSLLVVVDTSRPEQVLSEDLLFSCNRVAVIDHHRRPRPISPTRRSIFTSLTLPRLPSRLRSCCNICWSLPTCCGRKPKVSLPESCLTRGAFPSAPVRARLRPRPFCAVPAPIRPRL